MAPWGARGGHSGSTGRARTVVGCARGHDGSGLVGARGRSTGCTHGKSRRRPGSVVCREEKKLEQTIFLGANSIKRRVMRDTSSTSRCLLSSPTRALPKPSLAPVARATTRPRPTHPRPTTPQPSSPIPARVSATNAPLSSTILTGITGVGRGQAGCPGGGEVGRAVRGLGGGGAGRAREGWGARLGRGRRRPPWVLGFAGAPTC